MQNKITLTKVIIVSEEQNQVQGGLHKFLPLATNVLVQIVLKEIHVFLRCNNITLFGFISNGISTS